MGSPFKYLDNNFLYRYSGKTEYQSTHQNRARRTVQLERRPSQRYGRRQSHVLREREKRERAQSDARSPTPSAAPSPSPPSVVGGCSTARSSTRSAAPSTTHSTAHSTGADSQLDELLK